MIHKTYVLRKKNNRQYATSDYLYYHPDWGWQTLRELSFVFSQEEKDDLCDKHAFLFDMVEIEFMPSW